MKKIYILTAVCFISIAVFSQQNDFENSNNHFNENCRSLNQGLNCTKYSSSLDTLIVNMLNQINPDSMRQTIQSLQDFGTRFMLAPNRKEVANWIRDKYLSLGINNTVIDSFQTHSVYTLSNTVIDTVTWQYNVIATITGKDNPDKVYMTSGHYDSFTTDDPMTIAPGADDDASGVAAAIEIARIINAAGFEPNSTIKLAAFAAEELMYFSTESGASHYASNAVNTNENIVFYITNDMIACSESASDWKFQLLNHDSTAWVAKLGIYASNKFTSLTPVNIEQGNYGADDYPFYLVGIPALFFMENDFSPYYHTNNDLVEYCNMDYCAEVTKVTAAMLFHASETPAMVRNFFISNPGDGNTLIPRWIANTESDLAGYHIYCGEEPGIYDTIFTTTDTSFVITGLTYGVSYFIGVTPFNNDGNESMIVEKFDAPVVVAMDKGILIVCGSEGGIYNPTTEEIMLFYDSLCYNFEHQQINASGMEYLSLGTIGEYSTIFWHIDNYQFQNNTLFLSTDALRNFMDLGGHVLLTVFYPGKAIESIKNYPATYASGSFIYDCAHVASSENENNRWFSGAYPINGDYNPVYIDTLKIPAANHCIPFVEVMSPSPAGDIIYLYDTNFDTASIQGSYHGKVVGIENKSPYKNLVITSFPLFYLDYSQARTLVYKVLHDKFGETYFGIEDDQINAATISIYPNPAKTEFSIEIHAQDCQIKGLNIYSVEGKLIESRVGQLTDVEQKITIDISDLANGIYILQVISAENLFTNKLLKY
jgi:hypothetical protein